MGEGAHKKVGAARRAWRRAAKYVVDDSPKMRAIRKEIAEAVLRELYLSAKRLLEDGQR